MSQVYGRSPLCITITPRCRCLQDGITDILLKKIPVLWDAALYHISGVKGLMIQRIVVSLSSGSQSPRRVALSAVRGFFS
jgi:hypothetical protein